MVGRKGNRYYRCRTHFTTVLIALAEGLAEAWTNNNFGDRKREKQSLNDPQQACLGPHFGLDKLRKRN